KCGKKYSIWFAELGSGLCNHCNVSYQEKCRLRLDEQRRSNSEFLAGLRAGLAKNAEPVRALGRNKAMLLALGISAIQVILLIVLGHRDSQREASLQRPQDDAMVERAARTDSTTREDLAQPREVHEKRSPSTGADVSRPRHYQSGDGEQGP